MAKHCGTRQSAGKARAVRAVCGPVKEKRLYRYVVWQERVSGKGWLAQINDGKGKQVIVSGSCHSQAEAARHALTALNARDVGQRKWIQAELLLGCKRAGKRASIAVAVQAAVPGYQSSEYQHVYWHIASHRWEARLDGTTLGYCSDSRSAALMALALHLFTAFHDTAMHFKQHMCFTATLCKPQELQILTQVCSTLNLDDIKDLKAGNGANKPSCLKARLPMCVAQRSGHLPGDLENAVFHQTASRLMFEAEPGLEVLSVQGKYGPWRDALLQAWQSSNGSRQAVSRSCRAVKLSKLSSHQRALNILPIIQKAALQMHNSDQEAWIRNCGRNVSKVLGWLPLLDRIGAIKHRDLVPKVHRAGLKQLTFGALQGDYLWLPNGTAPVLAAVALLCEAGDILRKVLHPPPRTCSGWLQKYKDAVAALTPLGAPGLTKTATYVMPWTFRSMAVARMETAKISRLAGVNSVTLTDLGQMFPDQKFLLPSLAEHFRYVRYTSGDGAQRSVPLAEVLSFMDYKAPVQFFTMDLCNAADKGFAVYSADYIQQVQTEMGEVSAAYYAEHGIWPHTAVALDLVAQKSQ